MANEPSASALRANLTAIEDELHHQARELEKLKERLEYERAQGCTTKQTNLTKNLISHRENKLSGIMRSRASIIEKLQECGRQETI
jgi:hypothetical protein